MVAPTLCASPRCSATPGSVRVPPHVSGCSRAKGWSLRGSAGVLPRRLSLVATAAISASAAVASKGRRPKTTEKSPKKKAPAGTANITRKKSPKKKAPAGTANITEDSEITDRNTTVDPRRLKLLTPSLPTRGVGTVGKCVLYWMSRDQRVQDNWALLHARELAIEAGGGLRVAFCLVPHFLGATLRQFDFMLKGLREVEEELRTLGIPFELLLCDFGRHADVLTDFCGRRNVGTVVCDMSPLRTPREWTSSVAQAIKQAGVCCVQVDAHNVVPVWQASDKEEFAARTIRKKITSQYHDFLTPIPEFKRMPGQALGNSVDWEKATASLQIDRNVSPVKGIVPGTKAARKILRAFIEDRLELFAKQRNNPNVNASSGLSPYLHFGQISAQHCALSVRQAAEQSSKESQKNAEEKNEGCESYLEEAIVRRELADNFCWYQKKYDSIEGARDWALDTLKTHMNDPREHIYTADELEAGETHDDLWNAAQLQMVEEGKMHGFLRMYWAKKILEWMATPEEALRTAIYLNDKYELDGRDPSGYVGIMWSICGIHDMGFKERPIFGKIRFMNYAGCKRKFNVADFVSRYEYR